MLNTGAKKEALRKLKDEVDRYEERSETVRDEAVMLYELRHETASSIVVACEGYLSDLANAPRKLKKSVGKLRLEFDSFESTIVDLQEEAEDAALKSGSSAASGVAAGVGTAAFAPSAAVAIATTFGTASTGTAISTLSGAAATNAALAWLGGGALAAGGGGMAGGQAILAMAGPVGWAIGVSSLIGAGGYSWYKDKQIAEEATEKATEVHEQVLVLDRAHSEISELLELTEQHEEGVRDQLKFLRWEAPENYQDFTDEAKSHLGALINNVNALSQLLNRKIEVPVANSN